MKHTLYPTLFERWAYYVTITDTCWLWQGTLTKTGYGHFDFDNHTYKASRVAHEFFKGPIPLGLQLDHLCRNKRCVNPAHLEAVTSKENVRRYWADRNHRCEHGFRRKRDCFLCREVYRQRYEDRRAMKGA